MWWNPQACNLTIGNTPSLIPKLSHQPVSAQSTVHTQKGEEGVVQCSSVMKNAEVREEGVVQCSSVMKNAEVREEGVMQCSSVMKKRRQKMNRHKYKKWRKKMRFLRRSLGK